MCFLLVLRPGRGAASIDLNAQQPDQAGGLGGVDPHPLQLLKGVGHRDPLQNAAGEIQPGQRRVEKVGAREGDAVQHQLFQDGGGEAGLLQAAAGDRRSSGRDPRPPEAGGSGP